MVAESVWSKQYCPVGGFPSLCFPTWNLPLPQPLNLPINIAPIFLLFITSLIMPNASFVGHLSGVILGYLLVWNVLPVPNPLLTASLATTVVYLNERLFPWQAPDAPSSTASIGALGTSPPQWPRRYLFSVASAQIAVAFISLSCQSLFTVFTSVLAPILLLCVLRRRPWARPLFLTLPLLLISTLVSLAACASSFSRGSLYHQLGLSSSTLLLGQALYGVRALLALAALGLSLCLLAYQRDGQAALKGLGIEMGEIGTIGSIAPPAFSGAGRTLGGGGGGGGKQLGSGPGMMLGGGAPTGSGRRLGGTPTKTLDASIEGGEYLRIPTTDKEKATLVL